MQNLNTIEEIQAYIDVERGNGATIIQPSDLTPISYYRPVIQTIFLTKDDYYEVQGKFRLRYSGLTKLGNAAGVEWSPGDTCRIDNRADKMYIVFRAVGGIRKNDGKLYLWKAEYDLDLEVIEEETRDLHLVKGVKKNLTGQALEDYANKNTRRDMLHKRKHKLTLSETGAKLRVLRAILDIPNQYASENMILGMPFIVVRFVLDHQNPDIKQLFLQSARESMMGLYGRTPAVSLPMSCGEVIDVPVTAHEDDEFQSEPEEPLPDQEESQEIDFANSGLEDQVSTLCDLCQKTGYDLEAYLKKAGKGLSQMSEETRVKLFRHLIQLKQTAKAA